MTAVLISGASVAGLTLAAWLRRYEFAVTVVERHPGLRPGGQAIDVRGPALGVLERMDILDVARSRETAIRGMSVVDDQGEELIRNTTSTLSGGVIDNPDIEILRDDLLELLHAQTDGTRYLFEDTITALEQTADSVSVTFGRNRPEAFDLVVGADGLHSTVRRLAFGPEAEFSRRLGTFLAICTTPNFLRLDHWQIWHRNEAAQTIAGLLSARGNAEARALLGFTDRDLTIDHSDVEAQLALLAQRFADHGWVVPQLVTAMRSAPDFYCDEATQIRMQSWASGRIALVGDAACCCSPVGGQGSSVALIGAYTLAGELKLARRDGRVDYRQGYQAYEAHVRPYVLACQALAFNAVTNNAMATADQFNQTINSATLKDYS